jgi:two-component system, NarL family, sensor histidine kinase BarA
MVHPIDAQQAQQLAGGSRELARELYGLLVEELWRADQGLSSGPPAADDEELRALAHKLCSSARYCGAARLEQAARTAEQAVLQGLSSASVERGRAGLRTAIKQILNSGNPYIV